MSDTPDPGTTRRVRRRVARVGALGLLAVSATACSEPRFGWPSGITPQAHKMLKLWEGSAIAALIVGALALGAILWAIIVYRKKDDNLPPQVHQHLGVEIFFTFLPFVIIAGLFYYTVKDEDYVEKKIPNPDVTIHVTAFRWNWEFDHLGPNGQPEAVDVGRPGQEAQLVLPVGKVIQFDLTSPDVIHSFWVPAFLFKLDVIPGRTNSFQVTINQTGTFIGRCAELCGVDHDKMDFQVKVVSYQDYLTYLAGHPGLNSDGDPTTVTNTTGGTSNGSSEIQRSTT